MYLYQGEELGLPEHTTLEPQYRQDPTFFRTNGVRVGRDGARVPLPWQAGTSATNGFNDTGAGWLPQPDVYRQYSRDLQQGVTGSTLELYRTAIALRNQLGLGHGSFEWAEEFVGETSLGFINNGILVVHNFGSEPIALPSKKVLAASFTETDGKLEPNDTVWLRL